jgi:hypothetical protein
MNSAARRETKTQARDGVPSLAIASAIRQLPIDERIDEAHERAMFTRLSCQIIDPCC